MDALAIAVETTNQLIAAAAALGGAIVGGLITTGATWWFEQKRDVANVRQARRLVAEDVAGIFFMLNAMIDAKVYPARDDRTFPFFPEQQWTKYRGVLARSMDDSTWDVVGSYMEGVPFIGKAISGMDPGPISESGLEQLKEASELAAACYSILTDGKNIKEVPRFTA